MFTIEMFTIELYLDSYESKTGWGALDFERQMGLEEKGHVSRTYTPCKYSVKFPVPENFAREYLTPNQFTALMPVPIGFLRRGELVRPIKDCNDIGLNPNMALERAMQLFIASRVHRLQNKLQEAEREIADLRAKVAECEQRNDDIGEN